jgi:hypothetical protein
VSHAAALAPCRDNQGRALTSLCGPPVVVAGMYTTLVGHMQLTEPTGKGSWTDVCRGRCACVCHQARILQRFIPLFDRVLTDALSPERPLRVRVDAYHWYHVSRETPPLSEALVDVSDARLCPVRRTSPSG